MDYEKRAYKIIRGESWSLTRLNQNNHGWGCTQIGTVQVEGYNPWKIKRVQNQKQEYQWLQDENGCALVPD